MTSVLIVDDYPLVRHGLRQVFSDEFRDIVFGEAVTSDEAAAMIRRGPWDVVILDVGIPGKDWSYVLREARQQHPPVPVLVMSMRTDHLYAARARQLGAAGYICKDAGRAELAAAFKHVLEGKTHFGDGLAQKTDAQSVPRHAGLSGREFTVMMAIAAGKGTGEIATELKLSIKTVSTYKRRVLDKMRLKSSADLVRYVIDNFLS